MLRATVASVLIACLAANVGAQSSTPIASGASLPTDPIVASVRRTHEIRQSDVDAWRQRHAPMQFARLRQDVFESSRQAIDALVGEYLVAEEAAAQRISVEAFVKLHLDHTLTTPVRDEEVREIYERSHSMMGSVTFDQATSAIRSYLEETRRHEARQAFIDTLVANAAADVVIHLQPPRYEVPLRGDEESFGQESAALTVVEYSDFQCPFCKRAAPDLRKLVDSYPDDVRLVWRHFPLPGHPDAQVAAEAAACAGEQQSFWEYHDKLFANQESLGSSELRQYAEQIGLDVSRFDECTNSHRSQPMVAEDISGGAALGVSATPAVFVNGRLLLGAVGYDAYKRVIEEELAASRIKDVGKP
jgi:protein-disulfide isomerase